MKEILSYNSFQFRHMSFSTERHTDNSSGIPTHYLARMTRGTGRIVSLSGECLSLETGDVFYLPKGLSYHSYWLPDREGLVEWESLSFPSIPEEEERSYLPQILSPDGQAGTYLQRILDDMRVCPTTVGCLYLFLGSVLPYMQQRAKDEKALLLEKAKRYIASHPDFSVPRLARHCGISESGLYALFQSYAGMTPVEMKHRLQIESAITLLTTTDRSVEEISARLGFHSAGYFRRIFKQQTGKTPSQVRKATENKII